MMMMMVMMMMPSANTLFNHFSPVFTGATLRQRGY